MKSSVKFFIITSTLSASLNGSIIFPAVIQLLRHSTYSRFLWGFLSLYFLNISVDPSDITPSSRSEDLSINEQESVIELVVESFMGYEDAIEEQDDNDVEEHTKFNLKKDYLKIFYVKEESLQATINLSKATYASTFEQEASCHKKIDSPPPQYLI